MFGASGEHPAADPFMGKPLLRFGLDDPLHKTTSARFYAVVVTLSLGRLTHGLIRG
jgi:hypothetical protein